MSARMLLPAWLPLLCVVVFSLILRLAGAQDASSESSSRTECRMRRQEELIACRGVNTSQLVESLTRMRALVAEGRQLGEGDLPAGEEGEESSSRGRGVPGSWTVREVSFFGCVLPQLTAASLLTPSSLEIVSVIGSGVRLLLPDALTAHARTLSRLDLSHNLLRAWPDALVNLTRLEVLDLRHNEIDHLPEGTLLFNLYRLRQLHLDHNKLGQVLGAQGRLGYHSPGLSLAVFNLEPLRDSLTHLSVGHNAISAFPEQFSRPFDRLTNLDLSSNHISDVLEGGFTEMPRLQYLDLSGNLLHSFNPEGLSTSLLDLNLRGNPWTCTCSSQWILKSLRSSNTSSAPTTITTPTCSAPLHLRHRELASLTESELCPPESASGENRVVFVGDEGGDEEGPLTRALEFLHLLNATALNHGSIVVSWRVEAGFYVPTEEEEEPALLSWAIILRETREDPRSAAVTRMNLERYREERPGWAPGDSRFTELLQDLEPETQYAICLAPAQDRHLFVRPDKCLYVTTLARVSGPTTPQTPPVVVAQRESAALVRTESYAAETETVTMESDSRRVVLSWNVTVYPRERLDSPTKRAAVLLRPLGWRITYRRFGEENETEVVLVSRGGEQVQNFTNHYSVEGLQPGTAYTFCFHSLTDEEVSASYAGSTSEVKGVVTPQTHFLVSKGRSLQPHADRQLIHGGFATSSSSSDDPKLLSGVPSQRDNRPQGKGHGATKPEATPPTEENHSTPPSQEAAQPSSPIPPVPSIPSQGTGGGFPPNMPPVPSIPSQGTGGGFPPNIPPVPSIPSQGTGGGYPPAVPNFPSRRPPRPQPGGNFVYTSTGERIPLPSTSSGFGSPFNMPSIVGPVFNVDGSGGPPRRSSPSSLPLNSRQRFTYEFDDTPTEKPSKQTYTYDFTTEATDAATTTTAAATATRQIYTYETRRRKRSVEENSNTLYRKTLESGAVQHCQEIVTLDENDIITPVAIASTVSSSTTMVVVLLFCCCCPKRCRRKKAGWSGRPAYATRKVSTISAPTPVNVYSGNGSIITGSVIGEGIGNLKNGLPPRSSVGGGPLEREANGNAGRSVSVTSSAGYLTPMPMPNGVLGSLDQALSDAQARQQPDPKDPRLLRQGEPHEFHPGYDIPPTSSNKTLFGYDYPHPTPVNPIGSQVGRGTETPSAPGQAPLTSDPNYSTLTEAKQSEVNLNIPFVQIKSSGVNKSVVDLNPAPSGSVEYNYVAPEDVDPRPLRTYVKNAPAKKGHRKFGLPHRTGDEQLTPDAASSAETQDYNAHPLSTSRALSHSVSDLDGVGGNPRPSEAPSRISFVVGDHANSLPRLLSEEHREPTSLPPEQPLSAEAELSERSVREKQGPRASMYHTWTSPRLNPPKNRRSLGEVILTGGTLIEVPEGYVVPKPPKPARSVVVLTRGEEEEEPREVSATRTNKPPETLASPTPQEHNKATRRLPPLVMPSHAESEKSKITHLMTPEMEPNRIIVSTAMPV